MSRKKKGAQRYSGTFWETARLNQVTYRSFLNRIVSIALARFDWHGLPPTCDARYLEWTLLFQGQACICFPESQPGMFYSTQAVTSTVPNVYDNPKAWRSVGNNGWNFAADWNSGAWVWDNMARVPVYPELDMWAHELADIVACMRMNRQHVKVPFILTGPQERQLDMTNIYKQVAGGEPAIIATDSMSDITVDALQTGVEFLGEDLNTALNNTWQQVYTALGVTALPMKMERQIEDEVMAWKEPSELSALGALRCRRAACDYLVERFPESFPEGLSVTWSHDWESFVEQKSYQSMFADVEGGTRADS